MTLETSLYNVALNFVGLKEKVGVGANRFIQWCYSLCGLPDSLDDEVPWCSAFLNGLCFILGLDRSHSAAARSWLGVGQPIDKENAIVGMDIVVLSRGSNEKSGHVGLFAGYEGGFVKVLGGNQGDRVSIAKFPKESILGIRRLSMAGG